MREEVVVALRLDPGDTTAKAKQVEQAYKQIGETAGASARQTAFAMRQLPAQFTDVFTSLAGGQSPLLVLIQQGGQIKDSFGGAGAALSALTGAISPAMVAIGALAVPVGVAALAFKQGYDEANAFRDALAISGNAAGLTASRFELAAETISSKSKQTVGDAKDIALALAQSGAVGSKAFDAMGVAVARVADVTGGDSKKIASDFAGMSGGVAKWAAEHNKAWNFITVEQYKYIRRLEEQGKAEKAMVVTSDLVTKALEGQAKNLGYIETALSSASKGWSTFWNAAMGLGRAQTTREQLDVQLDRLKSLPLEGKARAAAELRVQFLKEQLKLENQMADARSNNAAKERQAIAAEVKNEGKAPEFPFGAIRDARGYYKSLFLRSEKDSDGVVAEFQKEQDRLEKERIVAMFRQDKEDQEKEAKRVEARAKAFDNEVKFLEDLNYANQRAGIELIEDEEKRGKALIELDRQIALKRLEAMGFGEGAQAEGRNLINQRASLAIDAMGQKTGESLYGDVRNALAAAFQDSQNPAKAFANALGNAIFTRTTARLADALATAAVGKDGAGGLWGDILKSVGSVMGGGYTVDTGGMGMNAPDLNGTRGGMATGTNFVPRDMFALLHAGEAIVPRRYNPAAGGSGGGGTVQNITYMVPAGASPAAYAAMLEGNNRRLKAEMVADLARPGRALNGAALAGQG
jgi:hypothetical protein